MDIMSIELAERHGACEPALSDVKARVERGVLYDVAALKARGVPWSTIVFGIYAAAREHPEALERLRQWARDYGADIAADADIEAINEAVKQAYVNRLTILSAEASMTRTEMKAMLRQQLEQSLAAAFTTTRGD